MLFNSINFLVFFVCVTISYFLLPFKFRWILLLLSSCYFYMSFVPIYILILGSTIVIDYFAGLVIEKSVGKKRGVFLLFSLVCNVGVLAVFKYYNFFISNLNVLMDQMGRSNPFSYLTILLPIGLSFHTFQAMSYSIEVYRRKQKAEKHFGIYALYVMFYPQLVAGPIERPQNIIHQFFEQHDFDYKNVTNGLKLMLWGYFKKIVIADNLAIIVNPVFNNCYHYKGLGIVIATIAFTFQIFCDFSGYSDIAIGAAQVMGFKLMTNFRRPYLAKSLADFWTRWHISLSTWFRDYVYIPLGGNRVVLFKWCFNILVVFIISGLWHGASWTFLIWGLLHAFFLISERFSRPIRKRLVIHLKINHNGFQNIVKSVSTFTIVALTWIFFRSLNLHQAFFLIQGIFKPWHLNDARDVLNVLGTNSLSKVIIGLFILLMYSVHFYQENYGSVREFVSKQTIWLRWTIYFSLLFSIFLFGAFENIKFIYFQF